MSWINRNSYELINTPEGNEFALKNGLKRNGDVDGANFFNSNVLVKIYEERAYLHADYYDLVNLRWARGLENHAVAAKLISMDKARLLYKIAEKQTRNDCLGEDSMTQFFYYLSIIETHMQDFIAGDFRRYDQFLVPLEGNHRVEIENFKRRFTLN